VKLSCHSGLTVERALRNFRRFQLVLLPLPLARVLLPLSPPAIWSVQRRGSPTWTGTSRAGSIRCSGGHPMIELSSQHGRRRWRVTDGLARWKEEEGAQTAMCRAVIRSNAPIRYGIVDGMNVHANRAHN
jgi:hypothetical protein